MYTICNILSVLLLQIYTGNMEPCCNTCTLYIITGNCNINDLFSFNIFLGIIQLSRKPWSIIWNLYCTGLYHTQLTCHYNCWIQMQIGGVNTRVQHAGWMLYHSLSSASIPQEVQPFFSSDTIVNDTKYETYLHKLSFHWLTVVRSKC